MCPAMERCLDHSFLVMARALSHTRTLELKALRNQLLPKSMDLPCPAITWSPSWRCSFLPIGREKLLIDSFFKFQVYNQFYDNKSLEIRSREVNNRLVLEGPLRVFWGVQGVIHLKEDDDQRTFIVRKRNSCRTSKAADVSLIKLLLKDFFTSSLVNRKAVRTRRTKQAIRLHHQRPLLARWIHCPRTYPCRKAWPSTPAV